MAVNIYLDLDYIEEFSLQSTKRYIRAVNGEWVAVDDKNIAFVEEDVEYTEEGEAYA